MFEAIIFSGLDDEVVTSAKNEDLDVLKAWAHTVAKAIPMSTYLAFFQNGKEIKA